MTKGMGRVGNCMENRARLALLLLTAAGLAGCGETPARPVAATRPHPTVTAQSFAPEYTAETPPAPGAPVLANDPSAPIDTPLCGSAAKEAIATAAAVYPDGLTSGSTCPQNACFEPLTGTFIAATGARSVCR
ncbi:hypothetical protein [Acidomonas methanolica]|uniref:Lipoprotein n=1 Tax=Acidomonas methanolica NBRC 104435 TaxID=1231351 RepID=A0A023D4F1_ACIMT|nr:hypothetical protein [Acidomonas methanolica]TCS28501.1 hypothetical protein EDC31_10890 [Acidomonas methanolica]GAJ28645.1 hypothetical protein Amme_032_023 [Acidomonas methanolica NBRC 104435]GBQ53886.1 hypothetical protein AA0498_2023 [Acidomonas methanolica]GEK99543.1 hypothetical protein AME01nite_20420 [Acidomonas methanolica NBRC 104435]